jgi:hypothetical protein
MWLYRTMASETHPQHQSSLLTRLPREILDKIYLELWRTCGLHQHILFHHTDHSDKDRHFCRWVCCTEYQVDDPLQADIEKLRARLNVPLGTDIQEAQPPEIRTYCRKLMSPWMNHWACGERATRNTASRPSRTIPRLVHAAGGHGGITGRTICMFRIGVLIFPCC